MANQGSSKMPRKVTTDIKEAILLIVTEDVAALRMFFKNLTRSIFKSAAKRKKVKQLPK